MTDTTTRTLSELVDEHLATWSETDPDRRLARVAACWSEHGALVDPPLDGHGHDGISALMGAMQEHYPGHRFVRTSAVDAHHDAFRVAWELRGEDGTVALAGVDTGLVADDGRIRRISGFFGELAAEVGR